MMNSDYRTLFVMVWAGFGVTVLAGLVIAFIWARRSGLFERQDQMRDLALRAGTPDDAPGTDPELEAAQARTSGPAAPDTGVEKK